MGPSKRALLRADGTVLQSTVRVGMIPNGVPLWSLYSYICTVIIPQTLF